MFTQEEMKLGMVKAAIKGKIKGYKMGMEDEKNIYPELKNKYEGIINELEDILKIITEQELIKLIKFTYELHHSNVNSGNHHNGDRKHQQKSMNIEAINQCGIDYFNVYKTRMNIVNGNCQK